MSKLYTNRIIAVLAGIVIFLLVNVQAQTTLLPPKSSALSSWQMFRGGQDHSGQQLRNGNLNTTPIQKWEYILSSLTSGGPEAEPVIVDVTGDGQMEVVSSLKGTVSVVSGSSGTLLWLYNNTGGGHLNGTPLVADVNNNDTMDVIIGNSKLYVLNGITGTIVWTFNFPSGFFMYSSPVVADVVPGGIPEIIITCSNNKVYCLNGGTGAIIWSYTTIITNEDFRSSPAVGDINGDGKLDVVVVSPAGFNNLGGEVIALNGNDGTVIWKYTNAAFKWDLLPSSPVIADVNQDCQMDILVPQGGNEKTLYNINGNTGLLQWSVPQMRGTPVVADIGGDCSLEIITAGPSVYNANGVMLWSAGPAGQGWQAPNPNVGDFNPNSPGLEIVVGYAHDTTGNINIISMYSSTGVLLWGYKKKGHSCGSIALGDIDNDGCVEIVYHPDCCNGSNRLIALDDVSGSTNCGARIPNAAFKANKSNPCVNSCINFTDLSSSCATSWTWDFPGGIPSSSNARHPSNICFNTAGTYTISLITSFGNCAFNTKDTAYLPITITCTDLGVNVNPDTSICAGECTNLSANPSNGSSPYSYIWSPGALTGSTVNVCPASTQTYTVIITDLAGATASETAAVIIKPTPLPVIAGTTTICNGDSTNLSASGGGTYSWSIGGTSTIVTVSPTTTTSYSVTVSNSGCIGTASVNIIVKTDCYVWPGDANNDSIVNNNDLLPIGLFYFQTGSARSNISNVWQAHLSSDWGTLQPNGSDIKHADCNGDGIINSNDTLAVNLNFNLTHAVTPTKNNQERMIAPELYLIASNNTYNSADIVNIEVWSGTSSLPVSNLYGIAFNIDYDASLVQTGTESLIYPNSWLGTPGTNAIKLSKIDAMANTAFGAMTRINHTNADGYGKIADFKFQLKNSIAPDTKMIFAISGYKANDSIGAFVLFNTETDSIIINPTATGINKGTNSMGVTISPNPFTSQTTISFTKEMKNSTLKVVDVIGKEVKKINFSGSQLVIEKGELHSGIYFLQIVTENTLVANRKIVIQ